MVALLGLMVSSGSLLAHRGGPGGGPGGMIMKHLRGLELTDAQKEEIRGLVDAFQEEHADEFEQMKALHEQAREQRRSGDTEGAKATMQQMKELRQSMKADHEELRAAILNVLTDEQRAQLEERKEKCQEKGDRDAAERNTRGRSGRGGNTDIE